MAFDYASGMPLLSESDSPFSSGGDLLGLIGGATGNPWLSALGGFSKMFGSKTKQNSASGESSASGMASLLQNMQIKNADMNISGINFAEGGSYNKPFLNLSNPVHVLSLISIMAAGYYIYKKVK